MKKIHLLILKSFIRPFIVTFFIVMFVLLMLFLFKYIDDLIGKGFEWYIIMELMVYSSATNVAMALPLSVLLSSIMTYGSLGENYELVAIKSAGISLRRALYPMLIAVCGLSVSAFFFSEYMLPVANLKYYNLLYDARKQKTAFLITENVFNNSFPGYSIRVKHKDPDGQTLRGIMLYHKPDIQSTNMDVIFAEEGIMFRSPDNKSLILRLKNGIQHQELPGEGGYLPRQRYTRFRFSERVQKFDLSGFAMGHTDENEFRGAFQMMNLKQLNLWQDSTGKLIDLGLSRNYSLLSPYFKYFSVSHKFYKDKPFNKGSSDFLGSLTHEKQASVLANALNQAKSFKDRVKERATRFGDLTLESRRNRVEYQKKFTLSAACLALFLIGAPLGAIIRKGGLGLPVVVAVIFFLIYYIISTIGEKFVKDGDLAPTIGMWIAIAVLTPIGMFLSYKAANDSELFNVEAYNKFIKKMTGYFTKKKPV
ncbi:YjgP/YjgQ family permease [Mucilaginibacter mali]|uniref:YjgP/YjgQ family permease n=1 Tax=Mucilaginibacter mali TaxID=2740462 RepID=A0A7D4UMY3_9SPHI|nr:LptF/LptG family permease [Mucilaginibacter mali]QKJ28580.1 YjgP/YjgQ family permease [Mucilaginibacter mali]